jgi:hypothetical protein
MARCCRAAGGITSDSPPRPASARAKWIGTATSSSDRITSENANDVTASIAGSTNTYQPMSRPQIGSVCPNGVR